MVFAQPCFPDLECAPKQRLSINVAMLQKKHLTKIVTVVATEGWFGPSAPLFDGQRTPIQALSPAVVFLLKVESAQTMDDLASIQMIRPQELSVHGQSTTIDGFCFGISLLRLANVGQIVQRWSKLAMFGSHGFLKKSDHLPAQRFGLRQASFLSINCARRRGWR